MCIRGSGGVDSVIADRLQGGESCTAEVIAD